MCAVSCDYNIVSHAQTLAVTVNAGDSYDSVRSESFEGLHGLASRSLTLHGGGLTVSNPNLSLIHR